MGAKKISITIITSIILIAILISLVNVGFSLFLTKPDFRDFCGDFRTIEIIDNREQCEDVGGRWEEFSSPRGEIDGFCDRDFTCRQEYDDARGDYNQIRYYVFAGIGFVLLLIGLIIPVTIIQVVGLSSGGFLVVEGILFNLQNKIIVFFSLLAIFIIFAIVAWRTIRKIKN